MVYILLPSLVEKSPLLLFFVVVVDFMRCQDLILRFDYIVGNVCLFLQSAKYFIKNQQIQVVGIFSCDPQTDPPVAAMGWHSRSS